MLFGMAMSTLEVTTKTTVKDNYREIKISKISDTINVSADALWSIARDFENVGLWSSNVKLSTGSGTPAFEGAPCSNRTCHVEGIGKYSVVEEKLVYFDESKRELAYQLTDGGPGFLLLAQNHWTVLSVGPNQSKLKMDATMRLKKFMGFLLGNQLKKTILKAMPLAMQEIKTYAETGEVSAAKKAQIRRLKK